MLHRTKRGFEKIISPICKAFIWLKIPPNVITTIGLLLTAVCGVAFALNRYPLAVMVGFVGGILDGVDGKVARDTGRGTAFGGFLDSTLDRISEIFIGAGILYSFKDSAEFLLAAMLVFASITGSLMTSYVRARAQGLGMDTKGGVFQRPERGVVIGIAALLGKRQLLWGMGILTVVSYITVLQRMVMVWRGLKNGKGGNEG